MIDQSGSMELEKDKDFEDRLSKMKDHIAKNVFGDADVTDRLKNIFNKTKDSQSRFPSPLFTGPPGAGKSKMIEELSKSMAKSGYDPTEKIIFIDDSTSVGKTSDILKDLLQNIPVPSQNLQKRFAPITLNPLSPDQMTKIVDIHLSKKGVEGEMRDIIREIAREHIAKNGTDNGARDVMDVIDELIANPEAPQIVARQAQRAEARQLVASKAEGAALAETMRKGVKVTVRPIKPVRFK